MRRSNRHFYRPVPIWAMAVLAMLAMASGARADVTNDDCTSAQVVSDGAPAFEGDNSTASATDDGEAACQASDNDVWFEYVATCTGAAVVDTFGSGQEDTVLSVYDACGGNEIACNDDTGGTLSQVLFAVTSGQSYWIRLASIGAPGDYDLNISCSGVPGNDDCGSAMVVTGGVPAVEGDNTGAVTPDYAEASCQASDNDVWFEYVATCTGAAIVDTFGSGQEDTVLSVYDACGGNEIACNDDTAGTLSQVLFAVTSGQPYWIRLATIGLPGDYDLNISCSGVPGNDDCDSAMVVTDGVPAAEGDNTGAVAADDDEASCRASDNDVWFEYIATCTGAATVDTFGSGQEDTVLSVYDACGGTEIACDDDTAGTLSHASFAVTSGQSYWIRLASIGVPGDYDLNITCGSVPGNDDCGSATVVTDGVPAVEGNNTGAVADDDEASCRASDGDVWYEYVATCTGAAIVDTFGSGQEDTVLSVYDGCGGSEIACDDDTGGTLSLVSFAVTSGQSYWIRLASIGVPGDYDLNITCGSVPGNDDCVSATVVTDGVPAAEGDNTGAVAADYAEASCRASDNDVWFEYVATCTGAAIVDTFGSAQEDTVLSVYDGCGGNELACDDDTGGTLSHVSFAVTSGQSYWIRLASIGFPGDYDLNIACGSVPDNDDCASATLVTDGVPAVEGDNTGTVAADSAEASCGASDSDVWFEYVATCTGAAIVDTFGSGQEDTVLSVYDACSGNEIACDDDTGGTLSLVSFAVTSGQSYWIRLASIGVPGDYDLNIMCGSVPTNDDCGSATVVGYGMPAAEGDNSGAVSPDDDEASCRASDNDVWFEYVATCTGAVTVDTFGSGQEDTVLSVYDGCGGSEIACNDDTSGTLSEVSFDVTAGQSYWVRLASIGLPGDYDLNTTCDGVPGNDNCTTATVVSDGVPAIEGHNTGAVAADYAEASCGASDDDVWFEYVATCTGAAIVDTFGSGQENTVLSIYGACGGNEIACNDDTGGPHSRVLLIVTTGQAYWIRLASIGVPGDYDLNITCNPAPANDNCTTATVVSDGVPAAEGDNTGAVTPDDAEAGCRASDNDVWFEYAPTCIGTVTIDTFGSGQEDTVLSVYEACGESEIACNDNSNGKLSEVSFFAMPSRQAYWIRLASAGEPGDFDLNITCAEYQGIPTISEWGIVVLALLLLSGHKVLFGRNRKAAT